MNKIEIPSIQDIHDTVKKALFDYLADPEGRITLYSKSKVAKLLDVSESTIDNLRIRGELQTTYIGKKPLFSYKDILTFLSNRKVNKG